MSFETFCNFADILPEEKIKELCPVEWKDFENCLLTAGIPLDDFSNYASDAEDEFDGKDLMNFQGWEDFVEKCRFEDEDQVEVAEQVFNAYQRICEHFEKITGLKIRIVYHELDDDYDELEGYAWGIENAYQMTPEAEKFKKIIRRLFWTNSG